MDDHDELEDLRDILEPPRTLALKIAGVEYVVQPCSAADGLRMEVLLSEFNSKTAKLPLSDFWRLTLGDTLVKLEEGARKDEVTRCAWTAFYWHLGHEEMARQQWRVTSTAAADDDAGKATAPTATPKKKSATRSRSTAGATTTRSQASTSGTKTPQGRS